MARLFIISLTGDQFREHVPVSENPNQPRKYDAVMGGGSPPPLTGAVLGGVDGVKLCLLSATDAERRISALKDALNKYGIEGLKLVIQALQTETGLVQWAAYDLLWERANLTGKQKLLLFFPLISEAGADYIQKVLEPSIIAMQSELKQLRLTVGRACKTQELIREHYTQANCRDATRGGLQAWRPQILHYVQDTREKVRVSTPWWEQGYKDRSFPRLEINFLQDRKDGQSVASSPDAPSKNNCVSRTLTYKESKNPAQSALIPQKTQVEVASTLKAQFDQQTALLEKLKPDLIALECKISEAQTKQDLFKAQVAAALASKQMKKTIRQIKACLQELGKLKGSEKSLSEKIQLLDSLILKIQERQVQVRQAVVSAIVAQKHIEHQYNHAQTAANIWQQQAQMDLQRGDGNLGREALLRRKRNADTASILKVILEGQTAQVETLKRNLAALDSMLCNAKTQKYMLATQSVVDMAYEVPPNAIYAS